jgi:hypothetical protein
MARERAKSVGIAFLSLHRLRCNPPRRADPMTPRPLAAISWSGGKDCCTALHRVENDFEAVAMVTMFNEWRIEHDPDLQDVSGWPLVP